MNSNTPVKVTPTIESAAIQASTSVWVYGKKINTAVWTACESHLISDPKQVREVFRLTEERVKSTSNT